jgi:hypothetical protein
MAIETRSKLSRSDFGEIRQEVYDAGVFKYALFRYQNSNVITNSEQWFLALKENRAVPGTIEIEYDEIMTYKVDPETKQRVKDDNGLDILVPKGRKGWTLVGLKDIDSITSEAMIEARKDALVYDKEAVILQSKVKVALLETEIVQAQTLSDKMRAKLTSQLLLDDDDETTTGDDNGAATVGVDSAGNVTTIEANPQAGDTAAGNVTANTTGQQGQ